MGTFIDIVMITLFVLFMVLIQRGYHQKKSQEREELRKKEEKE
ncbi:MAG: hypothetical protein OQK11_09960 [Thiovulaceae bacterium]|nr:hypothetical protein [Sulfurimonadaceae bacterium]